MNIVKSNIKNVIWVKIDIICKKQRMLIVWHFDGENRKLKRNILKY